MAPPKAPETPDSGFSHRTIERNVTLLAGLAFLVVAIGGIVEIAPLFWIDTTVEKVEGVRPYTPLELAGATSTCAKAATPATAR
jgi:cytochrome c oxidase cbb3-type subunit II